MPRPILAVSFDLWDTLIADDSDEPKRARAGLPSKPHARLALLAEAASATGRSVSAPALAAAWAANDAAMRFIWKELHRNWTVPQRLGSLLGALELDLPAARREALVRAFEELELEPPPDLVPGAAELLAALAGRYRLAVVSDAVVTPGRCLRQLLERHGVLRSFEVLAFSDEIGASKPARAMFDHVAAALGVEPTAIVHVGDRQHNDIAGAQRAGLRAVLFTGASRRSAHEHTADAVCERLADLPALLERLAAGVAL